MTNTGVVTLTRTPSWSEAVQVIWVAIQMGVLLLLARAFNLESPAFYNIVLPLTAGGFLIHHWLPRAWQLWFFAALSVAGVFLIFGLVGGAWLVGIGLGLIALCHVPLPFRWRVVLILLAAGLLVAMRATWLPTPWPAAVWPVLGSIFMFRLGMYLYDLKHRGPGAPGFVLSYFFLLPNSVFLLFPVIDFRTFQRTHYDKPAFEIYGEGVRWMFRGLTHLVLYRLIYQYVALSPTDVSSTATLVQYLVGNYGLYLRVSGQFHMIVGLLHLFGFRLPETHRFFYLASSFSDLWRRINIYWKDLMQKFVYLPVVFRLKRQSETTALVVATLCVVMATWLLHSYQWFWLLGEWLLSATDMAFWGVIGLLLIANTLREQRRGRERQLTAQAPVGPHAWRHAIQTAGMFTVMAVLWGVWTSPTFSDFWLMVRGATLRPMDLAVVATTLGVVATAAYVTQRFSLGAPSALAVRPRWQHPLLVSAVPLALFWMLGEPGLEGRVPVQVQAVAQQARLAELNKYDAERLQRGYYEQIVGVNRFNGELWQVYARAEKTQGAELADEATGLAEYFDQYGNRTYRPSHKGNISSNQWGMRDKEYQTELRPATRRIAVLGPSYVMGAGVGDSEVFEAVVEDRLNAEWAPKTGLNFELLNFAVAYAALTEQAQMLSTPRVAQFKPQVVILIANTNSMVAIERHFRKLLARDLPLTGSVGAIARRAGLAPGMSEAEVNRRLRPYEAEILDLAIGDAGTAIRRMGAAPVFCVMPMPLDPFDTPRNAPLLSAARKAGFSIIDVQDVFQGYDPDPLVVSPSNYHPNATGHRILADRFYAELVKRPEILFDRMDATVASAQAEWVAAWDSAQARHLAERVGSRSRRELLAESIQKSKGIRARDNQGGSWQLQASRGAQAQLQYVSRNEWRVTALTLPEKVGWHVKVLQAPLSLVEGREYRLRFRARGDTPRSIGCGVERHKQPYGLLGFYRTFDAGAQWQEFEWTFTADATESSARLFFDFGESTAAASVADIALVDVATGRPVTPRPLDPLRR